MTTIDLHEAVLELQPDKRRHGRGIGAMFRRWRKRQSEQRTLEELSRMPVHLLRDIGIDPADVYDALTGNRNSVLFNPIRKPEHDD